MIPLSEELGRGQYSVLLAKKLPQRVEHMASLSWKYTKMHDKKFYHIHWFPMIPVSLREIIRMIDLKGMKYDGLVEGEYHLLVRPRGEGHGKMLGGADLYYNRYKVRVSRQHEGEKWVSDESGMLMVLDKKYCNSYWFLRLISRASVLRTNMWLKNKHKIGR